ncbi:MAG: NAD(P)-binding protein [Pseudomonadales bacterium]|nr:NAD(P)-binding protein [Pseudomonadales bacterium]
MVAGLSSLSAQQRVALVGAGIAGMCSALALSRKGFSVDVFERDIPPPDGGADRAFFDWNRRGAAQFRHPHAFLGLMCSLLEEHYPDLLDDFFAAGARKVSFDQMVPPHLQDQYRPEAGDEKMWVLMCRRATMETIFRRYVEKQDNIRIVNTTYVTGIQTEQRNDQVAITGLELTDRIAGNQKSIFQADIYVDATGRASKFGQWLTAAGAVIEEEREDAEIVYYTRHYQLKPGVDEPDRHKEDPSAGDVGYMKYGVFPGDSGHFALIICLPNAETELREAVKDEDRFDAICMQIPGLVPWISKDRAEPTTPSFGIGEIHAVWRSFIKDDQPQVLNFFAVGDASARTNPLYGRGCSTGILHAHILADTLSTRTDPIARAVEFQKQTVEQIRPIYDASLREDKNGIRRADVVMKGGERDRAGSLKKWFGFAFGDALAAAARYEIHVFRGLMRTVNLVEKPGAFLEDSKIRRTVFRYMLKGRKKNGQARVQRGPNRQEMLASLLSDQE